MFIDWPVLVLCYLAGRRQTDRGSAIRLPFKKFGCLISDLIFDISDVLISDVGLLLRLGRFGVRLEGLCAASE